MKELVMIIRPEKLEDIKHILDKNASYHCVQTAQPQFELALRRIFT